MREFSFIHAADLHLDSPLRGLKIVDKSFLSTLQTASRSSLDRLVKEAIDRGVDFVIVSGDLLDGSWRDVRTGIYLCGRLKELAEAGIKTFIVSGNHDATSLLSQSLDLHPEVTRFSEVLSETVCLDQLGVALHGRSYPSQHVGKHFVESYPRALSGYFNIGVLHTSLSREEEEGYAPCTEESLAAKGYDYWALGHVHSFEVISRSPWIVYPGIPQGRSIRETGVKGAAYVQVKNGKVIELTLTPLDTVRWAVATVNVSHCNSLREILETVRAELQRSTSASEGRALILRLKLEGLYDSGTLDLDLEKGLREIPSSLGGKMTLEQIEVRSPAVQNAEALRDLEGPLERLLAYRRLIESDSSSLQKEVFEGLDHLFRKLPFHYFSLDSDTLYRNPERMKATLLRSVDRVISALRGDLR